jgi:hypothetical protein
VPVLRRIALFLLPLVACAPPAVGDPDTKETDAETDGETDLAVETDIGETDIGETDEDSDEPVVPPPPCDAGIAAKMSGVEYATIDAAIQASVPGDVVEICPGTWSETLIVPHDGPLTVRSLSGSPDDTILDGQGVRRLLGMRGLEPHLVVEGLTFTRGYYDGDPSLTAWSAIQVRGPIEPAGSAAINNCKFIDNMYGNTVFLSIIENANVTDSEFMGNYSVNSVDNPLYMRTIEEGALVQDCEFINNVAGYDGGAVGLQPAGNPSGNPDFIFRRNRFIGNDIDYGHGSALMARMSFYGNPRRLIIEDCTFEDNGHDRAAVDWSELEGGGAVWIDAGLSPLEVEITRTSFINNVGYLVSALGFSSWNGDERSHAVLRDVQIHGSAMPPYVWPPGEEEPGYAVSAGGSLFRVEFDNVDLGSGPTANQVLEFGGCTTDYDGVLDGVVLDFVDDPQGRCPWAP